MAHNLETAEPRAGRLKAGIYLPNPTSPNGWELYQVYGDASPEAEPRRLGLR